MFEFIQPKKNRKKLVVQFQHKNATYACMQSNTRLTQLRGNRDELTEGPGPGRMSAELARSIASSRAIWLLQICHS